MTIYYLYALTASPIMRLPRHDFIIGNRKLTINRYNFIVCRMQRISNNGILNTIANKKIVKCYIHTVEFL